MPTYEYQCKACGHEFEQFQSIMADSVKLCPKCKKRKVERKIGIGAGVIFKGGGFYETDYRSDSFKKGEEQERKAGEVKAESKADSPATGTSANGDDKAGAQSKGTEGEKSSPAPPELKNSKSQDSASTESKSMPAATPPDSARADSPRTGKTHAREGRGIGNVLQIGRGKSIPTKSQPAKRSTATRLNKSRKGKG